MDNKPGLEHECVWNHRIVFGVCVLHDVEVLLESSVRSNRKVYWAPTDPRNS